MSILCNDVINIYNFTKYIRIWVVDKYTVYTILVTYIVTVKI